MNTTTREESFLKTIQGTIKLHKLDRDGKLDSPEADEIRDDLDAHWYNMTEDQKNSIRNISERLYQIRETQSKDGVNKAKHQNTASSICANLIDALEYALQENEELLQRLAAPTSASRDNSKESNHGKS